METGAGSVAVAEGTEFEGGHYGEGMVMLSMMINQS